MKLLSVKGHTIPALGFGTYQLAGAQCVSMVQFALEIGYRHIDTAQMYDNEPEVGRALAHAAVPRESIHLTTKLWRDNLTRAAVVRTAEESLRRLRTDYVDLLLIHWPNPAVPLAETLAALRELRDAGKARAIGVSNFPVALVEQAVAIFGADLLCDQVEYHPLLSQRRLLDYLRSQDMILIAYSPLAQGLIAQSEPLRKIGDRHGKSPAQVALRWLVEQENVAAIPKAASEKHCRANFEIFDFTLSADDRAVIGRLEKNQRRVDPAFAPAWDRN